MNEIRNPLHGLSRRNPPGVGWRKRVGRRLEEVEERIEDVRAVRRVRQALLECECRTLEHGALPLRGDEEAR